MSTDEKLWAVVIIIAIFLTGWLAYRAWKRRDDIREYLGERRITDVAGPDTYRAPRVETVGLPDADTLTRMYAELGPDDDEEPEPAPARSYVLSTLPALDDYITGKIVSSVIESADNWSYRLGRWEAPAVLWEHLDPNDWFRELLTTEQVPA